MRLQVLLSSSRHTLPGFLLCAALLVTASAADVTPGKQADAAKLNNFGTALMNQQLLERAAAKFADAYQLDPALVRAEVNRGIALIYLQKMPEARQALEQAAAQDPKDPHIWYALGILYRIEADYPKALENFQRAEALDPDDADTHYFLGSVYLELHQAGAGPDRIPGCFEAESHSCIGPVWLSQSIAAPGQARGGDHGFSAL